MKQMYYAPCHSPYLSLAAVFSMSPLQYPLFPSTRSSRPLRLCPELSKDDRDALYFERDA